MRQLHTTTLSSDERVVQPLKTILFAGALLYDSALRVRREWCEYRYNY